MHDFVPEIPQWRLENLETQIKLLNPGKTNTPALVKKVLSLQRGLTGNRNLITQEYMSEKDYLEAYLSYYWPVSYAQALLALNQVIISAGTSPTFRILDIGSGPGPMACAALDSLSKKQWASKVNFEVSLFDISEDALKLARQLLEMSPAKVNITTLQGNLETACLPDGNFDLIIFGHSINEIAHNQEKRLEIRNSLVTKTLSKLNPKGIALIIEPALLSTSRDLIELRNKLSKQGYSIHGPCGSSAECTILQAGSTSTCHDESSWIIPSSVQKLADEAGLDRNSIKLAWFAFSNPSNQLAKNNPLYRVVSDPMLNKAGRVRYLLCTDGKRIPFSAKKDDAYALAGGFFSIKRGNTILIENPELRESGLGWNRDTSISYASDPEI